ncbi:hypothetical protein BBO_08782 [Beauveria brongniartii RCEF 3172]|uniref:Uncharacterized protein n=1 Tax=Beauveria brongniartii RCEF 3172 TaxID=1081107 RepID=A0A166X2N9_9HYPO|nr:hypothetical protein BBO_08782 [Beauveria brongniartii RCEF 3172]
MRLLPFLTALATAVIIPSAQWFNDSLLLPRQEQPLSQDCVRQCELAPCKGLCSVSVNRRGTGELPLETYLNNTLYKRVFNYQAGNQWEYTGGQWPTTGQANSYLWDVYAGGENEYYGSPLPTALDASECAVSQQVQFGNRAFQILSSGLTGCTVVVIASERAVWMAHFWQTYSNGPYRETGEHDSINDPVFTQRVLDHISGTPVIWPALPPPLRRWFESRLSFTYAQPVGPSVDRTLFTDGNTIVWIMAPVYVGTNPSHNIFLYPKRNREIMKRIAEHLGHRPKFTAIPYSTPQEGRIYQPSDGMALFQYDPNSDGVGTRGYRALFERRLQPPIYVW